MTKAFFAATSSACLSRQVGAAIYSNDGELVSIGRNDVPKFGGGLYGEDDFTEDQRCFRWGYCSKDINNQRLVDSIFVALQENGMLKDDSTILDFKNSIKGTEITDILEYSRSIHAEMSAIVSADRKSSNGVVGSILYTTTYPCHNCARHIVAAGIVRVVYIEPYPKSHALELHHDAITHDQKDNERVHFANYTGVSPTNTEKLFYSRLKRKDGDGKVRRQERKDAEPLGMPVLDSFTSYEELVVDQLGEQEGGV